MVKPTTARERKGLRLRDGVRTVQIGDHLKWGDIKSRRNFSVIHEGARNRFGNGITFSFASSAARKSSMDLSRTVTALAPV